MRNMSFGIGLLIVAVGLCGAHDASAATASVYVNGTVLRYAAAAGQTNTVGVSLSGSVYTVTDTAGISPGAGCTAVNSTKVTCTCPGTTAVAATLGDGNDVFWSSAPVLTSVEGGDGDDTLITGPANDVLLGGNGYDTLQSFGGDDVLYGGASDDTLVGGTGNDQLVGEAGYDTLIGEDGDDTIQGDGSDKVSYVTSTYAIYVDLAITGPQDTFSAGVDTITGCADVEAGSGALNYIYGNDSSNRLIGGSGIDQLSGRGGNDIIDTRDPGQDGVDCGAGTDFLFASATDSYSNCESVQIY